MSSFAKSLFSRRNALRFVIGMVALFALLFGVRALENWRGERAWSAYRADAEKRGVPYQRTAFLPSPVPDAENFAAIPIFQTIFAAHGAYVKEAYPLKGMYGGSAPRADRRKGEHLDFAKCRKQLSAANLLAQPTDSPAHDILTALAGFEPVLQQLRDAARRPHCHFPVRWEQGLLADTPHFDTFDAIPRVHALRLTALLALGDSPGALAEWRDVLALYRILEREPGLVSGLVRVGMLEKMVDAIWDGLAARQWAEPELRVFSPAQFPSALSPQPLIRQIPKPHTSFPRMPPDLGHIYDQHAPSLFAFVLNFTRSEADTRDVLQELFLKLASNPAQLAEVRDLRGYLIRLAHRLAIDAFRRRASHSSAVERAAAEPVEIFAPAPDADTQAFREALTRALAELPPEQRAVAHLHLWEGRTFAEIATALDIPANTAASRYRYAIDKLQMLLRPLYEELP